MTSQQTETPSSTDLARASMLRMASAWQTTGQINQAVDLYVRILTRYPDTPEAREATDNVVALAQTYERQGQYRLALDLYDRLGRFS